jgi:hypothetical protein
VGQSSFIFSTINVDLFVAVEVATTLHWSTWPPHGQFNNVLPCETVLFIIAREGLRRWDLLGDLDLMAFRAAAWHSAGRRMASLGR